MIPPRWWQFSSTSLSGIGSISSVAADAVRLLSAATLVETTSVLTSRKGPRAQAELALYIAQAALEMVPGRAEPAAIAGDASRL